MSTRLPAEGRAFLFLFAGRRVYRFSFTRSRTRIGRAEDNDIVINDATVRPHHAVIVAAADNHYVVEPVAQSPVAVGSRLSDPPVRIQSPRRLQHGDHVDIGGERLLFAREVEEGPMLHLIVRVPGKAPLGVWTRASTLVIGSRRGDLLVDDPLVSEVHAIIESYCPGGLFLVDAGGGRGTAVNGETLSARRDLSDGDQIGLGRTTIDVHTTAPRELELGVASPPPRHSELVVRPRRASRDAPPARHQSGPGPGSPLLAPADDGPEPPTRPDMALPAQRAASKPSRPTAPEPEPEHPTPLAKSPPALRASPASPADAPPRRRPPSRPAERSRLSLDTGPFAKRPARSMTVPPLPNEEGGAPRLPPRRPAWSPKPRRGPPRQPTSRFDPPASILGPSLRTTALRTGAVPASVSAARRPRAKPAPDRDAVDCTVFAPPRVVAGDMTLLQVFMHTAEQASEVGALAREFDAEAQRRAVQSLELALAVGDAVDIEVRVPGLEIDPRVQRLTWTGKPSMAQFSLTIPGETRAGDRVGTVLVRLRGTPIGHIKFKLTVAPLHLATGEPPAALGHAARRYQRAFVSYASADRAEVVKRTQLLKALRIDFFQDVFSLEPGDRWEHELYRHIDDCDLFLLFWSSAARASEWVEREARYALERHEHAELSGPEIVPIVLEGPPVPPPPDHLSHLHFGDPTLYLASLA